MIQLLAGDCRDVLPTLAADSVHTCITSPPYYALRSYLDAAHPDKHREIGSESSPDEYLATMVAVFREVRRVMRNDAVAFINMGDGYRDKQLLLMPARLALALQSDGWWVRSDIIWHKPNPMPESCTDRPTSAHEHVFLLTKSARYYYDADAVREEAEYGYREHTGEMRSVAQDGRRHTTGTTKGGDPSAGRSCRNVWTIATEAFPSAHFATYPSALAERCIRAGTSERGCCAACGAPWRRITDKAFVPQPDVSLARGVRLETQHDGANQWPGTPRGTTNATTTGWAPGCKCQADYDCSGLGCGHQPCICIGLKPCTVLDPFFGAGTTGLVAERLRRDCIGIDLNPDYNVMSRARIEADAPLFTSFPPAEPPEDERMADLFAGDEYQQAPKSLTTPRHDGNRWNENNGRGFKPRTMPEAAE